MGKRNRTRQRLRFERKQPQQSKKEFEEMRTLLLEVILPKIFGPPNASSELV